MTKSQLLFFALNVRYICTMEEGDEFTFTPYKAEYHIKRHKGNLTINGQTFNDEISGVEFFSDCIYEEYYT